MVGFASLPTALATLRLIAPAGRHARMSDGISQAVCHAFCHSARYAGSLLSDGSVIVTDTTSGVSRTVDPSPATLEEPVAACFFLCRSVPASVSGTRGLWLGPTGRTILVGDSQGRLFLHDGSNPSNITPRCVWEQILGLPSRFQIDATVVNDLHCGRAVIVAGVEPDTGVAVAGFHFPGTLSTPSFANVPDAPLPGKGRPVVAVAPDGSVVAFGRSRIITITTPFAPFSSNGGTFWVDVVTGAFYRDHDVALAADFGNESLEQILWAADGLSLLVLFSGGEVRCLSRSLMPLQVQVTISPGASLLVAAAGQLISSDGNRVTTSPFPDASLVACLSALLNSEVSPPKGSLVDFTIDLDSVDRIVAIWGLLLGQGETPRLSSSIRRKVAEVTMDVFGADGVSLESKLRFLVRISRFVPWDWLSRISAAFVTSTMDSCFKCAVSFSQPSPLIQRSFLNTLRKLEPLFSVYCDPPCCCATPLQRSVSFVGHLVRHLKNQPLDSQLASEVNELLDPVAENGPRLTHESAEILLSRDCDRLERIIGLSEDVQAEQLLLLGRGVLSVQLVDFLPSLLSWLVAAVKGGRISQAAVKPVTLLIAKRFLHSLSGESYPYVDGLRLSMPAFLRPLADRAALELSLGDSASLFILLIFTTTGSSVTLKVACCMPPSRRAFKVLTRCLRIQSSEYSQALASVYDQSFPMLSDIQQPLSLKDLESLTARLVLVPSALIEANLALEQLAVTILRLLHQLLAILELLSDIPISLDYVDDGSNIFDGLFLTYSSGTGPHERLSCAIRMAAEIASRLPFSEEQIREYNRIKFYIHLRAQFNQLLQDNID